MSGDFGRFRRLIAQPSTPVRANRAGVALRLEGMEPTTQYRPRGLSAVVDRALDATIVPGYTSIGRAVRSRLPGWPDDPNPGVLAGRHVLVTGASSGLGEATAAGLAGLGAFVHLVVRDRAKGEQVVADLGLGDMAQVHRCDLSDLDDVRALARELLDGAPLAAVVHNAGVMPPERAESAQGHELSMAVHVLGPVLLTELLLPVLDGARVVFVTSGGMYAQKLRADDPEFETGDYSPTTAYARSKRAQVELLPLLDARWRTHGLEVNAMHPGWAATPGVTESLPGFEKVVGPLLRDPATGADTAVWLAAAQPSPGAGLLWQDRRPRPTTWFGVNSTDEAQRARLWAWVRDQTGLTA